MKRLSKYAIITILIAVASSSCEKFSGDNDSVTGLWQCRDESNNHSSRRYSVTIYSSDLDTTQFIINNFYNLGNEIETYAVKKDSILTIWGNSGSYSITGRGRLAKDFSSINWEYSISGGDVDNGVAYYYRK